MPNWNKCCRPIRFLALIALLQLCAAAGLRAQTAVAMTAVEIQVVDSETGRGVPLVTLTSVDEQTWLTDSAGRVAVTDPDLLGQRVFFTVSSPGYQYRKDGFGYAGTRLELEPGSRHELQLQRLQPAERLYRITGRGQYRATAGLGREIPDRAAALNGQVVGQDSVQTAIYNGRMHWFWGDTSRLAYPLGLFRTAGAITATPSSGLWDPQVGIPLKYFVKGDGFVRAMVDVPESDGVVWIQGVCTVRDQGGRDRMVCQYSRRRGLAEPLEQGHLIWNDEREIFEVLEQIPLGETWRQLGEHPDVMIEGGTEWLVFGRPFPTVRVPATVVGITDRAAYQAWSCLTGENVDKQPVPQRTAAGRLDYGWRARPPVTQQMERRWLQSGLITADEVRYLPQDAEQNGRVVFHAGTVRFNPHRGRWILLGNEQATRNDAESYLGEVYYSEAETPQGPFMQALRIATHPGQSYYNPCQHVEFDAEGGAVVLFEGTYTNMFTQSQPTALYNYNQLMYRLDLRDKRLIRVFGEAQQD